VSFEYTGGQEVNCHGQRPAHSLTRADRYLGIRHLGGVSGAVELIHPGKCEVQVPILYPNDAANRYPHLVVLREEQLELWCCP
jgi:hypothetical protein